MKFISFPRLTGLALAATLSLTGCRAINGDHAAGNSASARADQAEIADFRAHYYQLCDLTAAKVSDETTKGPYFVDSYAVRSLCVAYDLTGNQKYLDACRNWSERMVTLQSQMVPAGAYYMHYNRKPGETSGDWYAADSSSIGMGVLATAVRCQGAEKQRYLDSAEKFADLVLNNYVRPSGGVSDGLWKKSDQEWWCSSGLFGSFMFNLYINTHDDRYLQAGLHIVDWLDNWDPLKDQPFPLSQQGPSMPMYVMECYSAGWPYISADPDRAKAATAKVSWCFDWIAGQQAQPLLARKWAVNEGWGLKFGGLPFHQYIFSHYLPADGQLVSAGDKELQTLQAFEFKGKPELTQLPFFMMMSYAERLDPGAMYRPSH